MRSQDKYRIVAHLVLLHIVLKSSGSAFENFLVDDFTTLTRTWCSARSTKNTDILRSIAVSDRILSTAVDYEYTIILPPGPLMIDGLAKLEGQANFTEVASSAKAITMDLFATDESASVQVGLSLHNQWSDTYGIIGSAGHRVQNVPRDNCEESNCGKCDVPTPQQALHSGEPGFHET